MIWTRTWRGSKAVYVTGPSRLGIQMSPRRQCMCAAPSDLGIGSFGPCCSRWRRAVPKQFSTGDRIEEGQSLPADALCSGSLGRDDQAEELGTLRAGSRPPASTRWAQEYLAQSKW